MQINHFESIHSTCKVQKTTPPTLSYSHAKTNNTTLQISSFCTNTRFWPYPTKPFKQIRDSPYVFIVTTESLRPLQNHKPQASHVTKQQQPQSHIFSQPIKLHATINQIISYTDFPHLPTTINTLHYSVQSINKHSQIHRAKKRFSSVKFPFPILGFVGLGEGLQ
jgi:hypothetical protein